MSGVPLWLFEGRSEYFADRSCMEWEGTIPSHGDSMLTSECSPALSYFSLAEQHDTSQQTDIHLNVVGFVVYFAFN